MTLRHAVWYFVRRYAAIYSTLLLVLVASALLESLNVAALFPFAQAILETGQAGGGVVLRAINTLVGMVPVRDRVIAAAVLLGVAILIKGVVAFLLEALIAYGSGRVVYETKQQIFTRYSQAQYQFFIDHHQGDLTYRVTTAPQSLGLMLLLVPYSLTQLFTIAFIGVLLATIDWRLTVGLAAIGLPFYGLIRTVARRVSYMTGKGRARALANELGLVSELVGGIKEIMANLATGRWARRYAQESQAFRRLYVKDMIWQSVPGILIELVTLSLMGAAVLVYRLTVGGPITSGLPALAVFAYAIHRLIAALSLLSRYRLRMGGLLPDVELLYTTLHTSAPAVRDGPRRDVVFSRAITFDNVSFVYPHREEHAVYDITLTIPKGRVTGIVGPSGSGKTTLINLLLRLYDPTHGVILVDDTNLAEYRRDAWLHRIGYVSQETFLFSGSVEDNIRFGREATREEIAAAAMAARAHEFIVRLPQGYDTLVGDRGMTLSGGQRQRIAIARALLRQPQVLIFDEATSALDTASEALIRQAIREMAETHTVVLIAHRLSTVAQADKIIVLDGGRVVEEGTHRDLLTQGGPYARLVTSAGGGGNV
jgi:ABC-type multidrug transport system fused ATPase/permease subunit